MSDQQSMAPEAAPAAVNPVVANAAQALAVKELGETVAGVKKQIRTLWISFGVLAVVVLFLAVMTFVPALRFGMMGGRAQFRGQFGNGTFQGPAGGFNGGATNGGATNGGAPGGPTGGGTVTTP